MNSSVVKLQSSRFLGQHSSKKTTQIYWYQLVKSQKFTVINSSLPFTSKSAEMKHFILKLSINFYDLMFKNSLVCWNLDEINVYNGIYTQIKRNQNKSYTFSSIFFCLGCLLFCETTIVSVFLISDTDYASQKIKKN